MKQAIIDIGSNSIRLTLYEVLGTDFKVLFRTKNMAGLAGYVEKGALSAEGIECAKQGLLEYRDTLLCLGVTEVSVFATASLRNISNTNEAISELQQATGFHITVIDGGTEAFLGYYGAMLELHIESGAFLDIGGASTELVSFSDAAPINSISYPFGSLSLYKNCVKKIIPGENSIKQMTQVIRTEIKTMDHFQFDHRSPIVCVGGTARTLIKLAQSLYHLPLGTKKITAAQIEDIYTLLTSGSKSSYRLILKLEPDRIHTIIPGLLILRHIVRLFHAEEIIISKYGVREGYLCQNIILQKNLSTHIPKTGN